MTQQALRELVAKWRHEECLNGLVQRTVDEEVEARVMGRCADELESLLGEQREAQGPKASKDLITLTGNQAEAILEAFGGEPTTVSIRRMKAFKDVEDGSDMPAGLYLYYTEYPEEGCIFLGEDDEEYKPFYVHRSPVEAMPAAELEKLADEMRKKSWEVADMPSSNGTVICVQELRWFADRLSAVIRGAKT